MATERKGRAMRKPETDWFVFQPSDDEATVHASYRLAVRDAQYRGDTDDRPKRIVAGHYELFGCGGHQYFIVSKRVMKECYLQLMELAYEDAA